MTLSLAPLMDKGNLPTWCLGYSRHSTYHQSISTDPALSFCLLCRYWLAYRLLSVMLKWWLRHRRIFHLFFMNINLAQDLAFTVAPQVKMCGHSAFLLRHNPVHIYVEVSCALLNGVCSQMNVHRVVALIFNFTKPGTVLPSSVSNCSCRDHPFPHCLLQVQTWS